MAQKLRKGNRQDRAKEPHDTFFRQFMAQPAMVADFVQNYLPAEVVALLDLTKLQPEKDTFVDAQLRKHFSDLLYSVPLKSGGKAYLYFLFEHKSRPDKQARLQLLRYMIRIWEQEWRKHRQLSPIVPILFYHGQEKWSYSTEFADLVESPEALKPYTPHFRHLLTDLSAYSDEEVRGEVWLRVGLLALKHIFDQNLGQQLPHILGLVRELVQQESGLEMLRTLLLYIAQANQVVTEAEFERGVAAAALPEGENLMATLAEKWKEEGRAEGLERGLERGLEKGLERGLEKGLERGLEKWLEAQRQMLLRLLEWRFQLDEAQKAAYHQQVAQLNDLPLLTQLIDHLLAVQTLAEFDVKLLASLSTTNDS